MANAKEELATMMNRGLELEHMARIQYLTHAELVSGLYADPIRARLVEIAGDEKDHEDKFRTLIADYLDGEPSMRMAEPHRATEVMDILEVNRRTEKEGLDLYRQIYRTIIDKKAELPYEFETIEHEMRHIILDEQEHITELKRLIGS